MSNSTLDLARELAVGIRSRGDEIEHARQVPADLIDELRQAGVFRLCIPKALGGSEAPTLETLRVIEEIARADRSPLGLSRR